MLSGESKMAWCGVCVCVHTRVDVEDKRKIKGKLLLLYSNQVSFYFSNLICVSVCVHMWVASYPLY